MTTDQEREELLTRLGEQAEALATSAGWRRWLTVATRFRSYSLHNQLLIVMQRPDATAVAGYRAWQEVGRQVRRGERGIAIFAPNTRKVADEADPDVTKRVITGFRLVRVFDISQTDGEPLPGHEFPAVHMDDVQLYDELLRIVQAAGFRVDFVPSVLGSTRGWYSPDGQAITLVASYNEASRTRTLLHELGHAHDPHLPERIRDDAELVAETSAYIVGTGFVGLGMDDASTVYVTSWQGTSEQLGKLATDILTAARTTEKLIAPLARRAVTA